MAKSLLAGSRIREYRIGRGLRQIELAASCDISPSYLNLIEHNRRRIGGALLNRIADVLQTDPATLSDGAEAGLTLALDAAAEAHVGVRAERDRADEFASRFPGWARLIETQYREARRLEQSVERLDDRLTHDPFLSASMHNVLTSVTAIRSAAAILASDEAIEPEWQARFHRNIHEDSQRLAEAAGTLVDYLDSEEDDGRAGSLPQEEVEQWLSGRGWAVAELDADPDAQIEGILGEAEPLTTAVARAIAHRFLTRYAEDARAVPNAMLAAAIGETGDPIRLASALSVPLPTIFRRLASRDADFLPDRTAYGLAGCDASGTLIFRKPIPGFDMPRYGGACALWPLFRTLQQPMMPLHQIVVMSGRDETRFEVNAVSELDHPLGYDGPAVVTGWMLIRALPIASDPDPALKVGTSCRICAERECPARREPSVFSSLSADAL